MHAQSVSLTVALKKLYWKYLSSSVNCPFPVSRDSSSRRWFFFRSSALSSLFWGYLVVLKPGQESFSWLLLLRLRPGAQNWYSGNQNMLCSEIASVFMALQIKVIIRNNVCWAVRLCTFVFRVFKRNIFDNFLNSVKLTYGRGNWKYECDCSCPWTNNDSLVALTISLCSASNSLVLESFKALFNFRLMKNIWWPVSLLSCGWSREKSQCCPRIVGNRPAILFLSSLLLNYLSEANFSHQLQKDYSCQC